MRPWKYCSATAEFAEMDPPRLARPRNALPFRPTIPSNLPEPAMSKEQRATKNTKKPKKDAVPPKAAGSDRPTPPVTSVMPKGKLAKKPA